MKLLDNNSLNFISNFNSDSIYLDIKIVLEYYLVDLVSLIYIHVSVSF